MQRIEIIKRILSNIKDECIITSCGMISREVYSINDRDRNFYLMSAMGSELALGLGLAYSRPDLNIIVISGDGSALMGFSTKILQDHLMLQNLTHYILNNNCHATTGGQKTCFQNYQVFFNTYIIDISNEKGTAPRIPLEPKQITERFKNAINIKQKK